MPRLEVHLPLEGGGGGVGFADFGGIDPSMDPEFARALRVSMEEERARQERVSAALNNEEGKSGDGSGDAEPMDVAPAAPLSSVAECG